MPVVSINPKNSGTITLGPPGTPLDISCQVVNFKLQPENTLNERAGTYCAADLSVPAKAAWKLQFTYLQDWRVTGGLSQFLLLNDAVLVDFSFHPDDPLVPVATGQVYVTAGAFGGAAAETWEDTGEWSVEGTPVFTAPVVADDAAADVDYVDA